MLPKTDMSAFSEAHPEYSAGLLSFVLEYMTFTFWPTNSFIPQANVCQTSCSRGQEKRFCGCTCMIDAFAIDDEKVGGWVRVLHCPLKTNGDSMLCLISARAWTHDSHHVANVSLHRPCSEMTSLLRIWGEVSTVWCGRWGILLRGI